MTDSNGMISFSNPAFDEMFGFNRGELIGQHMSVLNGYSDEENARIVGKIDEQLKTEDAWYGEFLNVRKDGSNFYTYARISALEISGKEYWISVQEDITDRKRAEDALREAKRASESANEAKSQFLANMSHELRNPLNSIIGFSEILDRRTYGELNSRQSRYVSHILDSGRHLLDLVNGMFALAQVESGKAELELTDVSLSTLLDNSLSWIKPGSAKRGLNLDLNIADELTETMIRADAGKLKQIMFYLLSHAVKSTPDKGDIKVSARREGEDILVSVSDTGAGLESSDLELIFVPFDHADFPRARKQQGAGLGLSLAKLLSELHGGRLSAESEGPGKGSTFTFVIPYVEAATPEDSTST